MSTIQGRFGAAGALALMVLVSAPATADEGVTLDTILMGLEGKTNSFSADEENLGFRLAFQERNDRGPIHGRKIAWPPAA